MVSHFILSLHSTQCRGVNISDWQSATLTSEWSGPTAFGKWYSGFSPRSSFTSPLPSQRPGWWALELKSHPGQLNYYYKIHQIKLQFESYTRRGLRNKAWSLGIEIFGTCTKHQESRNKVTGDLTLNLPTSFPRESISPFRNFPGLRCLLDPWLMFLRFAMEIA